MSKFPVFGYATKRLNPLTGCTANCPYCWARRMAHRLKGRCGYPVDNPFTPTFHPERLREPEKWRNPQVVACNFMGDWMDKSNELDDQSATFQAICNNPDHTFLLLTKQANRLLDFYNYWQNKYFSKLGIFLPDNIYNGLTITNQRDADEKLPVFLQIPGKKWLSIEPLIDYINLECAATDWWESGYEISQVIVGGMSGPEAKNYPLDFDWVRKIIDDCVGAGVPIFVKQLHINGKLSKYPAEWPEEFRVRQLAWEVSNRIPKLWRLNNESKI